MTRIRRDERIIDFTPEALAALPMSKGYSDIWYDRTQRYLAYRPPGTYRNARSSYIILAGKEVRRGAELNGVKIPRFISIDAAIPIEEVRVKAKEIYETNLQYKPMGKKEHARGTARLIPVVKETGVPEDILKVAPEGESNYDRLLSILMDAYEQAAKGKGAERHGNGLNFEDQDMMKIMDRVGINFALGQAIKKITEGSRLRRGKAKHEFLGAIIYLAGAILWMNKRD